MQLIKDRFARHHNLLAGGRGSVWQSRYHERALRNERELLAAVEYVHQNPVVGKLATTAEEYRWSSACGQLLDLVSYLGQAESLTRRQDSDV